MKRVGLLVVLYSCIVVLANCSSSSSGIADAAEDLAGDQAGTDARMDVTQDSQPPDLSDVADDVPGDVTDLVPDLEPDAVDTLDLLDITPDEPDVCQPACDGKQCGDDGCGSVCGTCEGAQSSCVDGACVCSPNCTDKMCGDDGCGGSCGDCVSPTGMVGECVDGTCVCVPTCEGKECGGDGCGGKCGSCDEHFACVDFACQFQPWCGDLNCNTDLSEDCSSCPSDCSCGEGNVCVAGTCCTPSCDGIECGSDGCGGSCGSCGCGEECVEGSCFSTACEGKLCGDDGCGGTCGSCGCGEECLEFACVFSACDGKQCGDDGCGGSCGTCDTYHLCQDGACVCPEGWTGPSCDLCAPGYYGPECKQCPCWPGTDVLVSDLAQFKAEFAGDASCYNRSTNSSIHDWSNTVTFYRPNCGPDTCGGFEIRVGTAPVVDTGTVPPSAVDSSFFCSSNDTFNGPLPAERLTKNLTLGEAEACNAMLAEFATANSCPGTYNQAPFCPCWPTPTTLTEDLTLFESDTTNTTCYNGSSPLIGQLWTLSARFLPTGCTPSYCVGMVFTTGRQIKFDYSTVPPTQVGTMLACTSVDSYNGAPPAQRSASDLFNNEASACVKMIQRLAKTENCPGTWTTPLDP